MNRCERCGVSIPFAGRGRVRRFCSGRCRVAAHRARRALPEALTKRPRWVRRTAHKVPVTIEGRPASSTNPDTWSDYAAARRSDVGAGLGFVLNGDGVVCIDLDHCLTDGGLAPWARDIVDRCPPTFIERSPSGGLHIWGTADFTGGRRVRVDGGRVVEVYGSGRYITVTGRRFEDAPATLGDLTSVIAPYLGHAQPAESRVERLSAGCISPGQMVVSPVGR